MIRRILHISDTHGYHRRLGEMPEADVLVHSGDFTMSGSEAEALDFIEWLCALPYEYKVFVAGNHDECLYDAGVDGLDNNVHYLRNSGIEIDGIKFYGVPLFMKDCISDHQSSFYGNIPEDTDILITHAPPYGILDCDGGINYGSSELLARLSVVKPHLHLFGHIHNAYGTVNDRMTIYSNAAIVDGNYDCMHRPVELEFQEP